MPWPLIALLLSDIRPALPSLYRSYYVHYFRTPTNNSCRATRAQIPLISAAVKAKRRGRQPRRTGHNLLLRLRDRKPDVLRFLTDPDVPFTNNLAERDGRMMKLRQKISGGFRSVNGAEDFAVIRTLISTAKKQGWDLLAALTGQPKTLIAEIRWV